MEDRDIHSTVVEEVLSKEEEVEKKGREARRAGKPDKRLPLLPSRSSSFLPSLD